MQTLQDVIRYGEAMPDPRDSSATMYYTIMYKNKKMAELDSVPFRWATDEEVANQMWKMTTKTNGISIKLKLADGQSMTIQ